MSCGVTLNIEDAIIKQFGEFKKGNGVQWLSMKLDGKDLNQLKLVSSGDKGATYDEFTHSTTAFPKTEARYCWFNFSYDLGLDGKRTKTVFFAWVPSDCSVKEKLLYAAARGTMKRALGYAIELQASSIGELDASLVKDKCMQISR